MHVTKHIPCFEKHIPTVCTTPSFQSPHVIWTSNTTTLCESSNCLYIYLANLTHLKLCLEDGLITSVSLSLCFFAYTGLAYTWSWQKNESKHTVHERMQLFLHTEHDWNAMYTRTQHCSKVHSVWLLLHKNIFLQLFVSKSWKVDVSLDHVLASRRQSSRARAFAFLRQPLRLFTSLNSCFSTVSKLTMWN